MKKKAAIFDRWFHRLGGGERVVLETARALDRLGFAVTLLTIKEVDPALIESQFGISMDAIKIKVVPDVEDRSLASETIAYDLFVNASYADLVPNRAKHGLLLVYFPTKLPNTLAEWSKRAIIIPLLRNCMHVPLIQSLFAARFPKQEQRLYGGPSLAGLTEIDTYDKILGISQYTQEWIHRRWGRSSQLLYPPVAGVGSSAQVKKKNWIVHTGRFFVGDHTKGQHTLATFFRALDPNMRSGWELHFIGTVGKEEVHKEYLDRVRQESEGLPIFFHIDVSFSKLQETLAQAKIYWHATGYGRETARHPESLEHFGITTVEAMSAGVVPIVYGAGGQAEIVTPQSGYTWQTQAECLRLTEQLMGDEERLTSMATQARARAAQFNLQAFERRLDEILTEIGA